MLNKFFYVSFSIIIILIFGLRDGWGYDYFTYRYLYENEQFPTYEISYWLVNKSHHYFFNSFDSFVFITAAFVILVKCYFIYEELGPSLLGLFLLLFMSIMPYDSGLIRNSISSAFVLLSFVFFKRSKIITSFIFYFFSLSFHYAALFYLPLQLKKINSVKVIVCLLLIFGVLIFIFPEYWKDNISRVGYYIDNSDYAVLIFPLLIIRCICYSILFCKYVREDADACLNFYLYGVAMMCISFFNVQIYTRIHVFISAFEPVLLILTLRKITFERKKISHLVFLVFCLFILLDIMRLSYNFLNFF